MNRSPFGWSLPPGAAGDPNAPWNQEPGPCAVCGQSEDDCICPECSVCGAVGDPACYDGIWELLVRRNASEDWRAIARGVKGHVVAIGQLESLPGKNRLATALRYVKDHGLVRSFAQVALAAEAERLRLEEIELDRRMETEYLMSIERDEDVDVNEPGDLSPEDERLATTLIDPPPEEEAGR